MTMGLACDDEGYDLSIEPCKKCGSRGCSRKNTEACDGKKNPFNKSWHYDSRGYCDNPGRGY